MASTIRTLHYQINRKSISASMVRCDLISWRSTAGVDIQIDVLGIVKKAGKFKLFFIEAKKTSLTLRDLGQLWAYCKLIDPEEAFLLTSADLGSLNKILNIYKREDLLDFGDGKRIKKMKIAVWNMQTNRPDPATMILLYACIVTLIKTIVK